MLDGANFRLLGRYSLFAEYSFSRLAVLIQVFAYYRKAFAIMLSGSSHVIELKDKHFCRLVLLRRSVLWHSSLELAYGEWCVGFLLLY